MLRITILAPRWVLLLTAATLAVVPGAFGAQQQNNRPRDVASGLLHVVPRSSSQAVYEKKLMHALAMGQGSRVHELADKLELNHVMRRVFDAQLQYDMPTLLRVAKECRKKAFDRKLFGLASWCNANAFGAASRLGDTAQMFQLLAWLKRMKSSVGGYEGSPGPEFYGNTLYRANLVRIADSIPSQSVERATSAGSIPVVNWTNDDRRASDAHFTSNWNTPKVDVRINGRVVRANVDTGSATPLVLDTNHARRLGVVTLIKGLTAAPTLDTPTLTPGNASLGLVHSFTFGPLTIHNLAVKVVPNRYARHGVRVGLPILARFNQVTFTGNSIQVSMNTVPCAHPLPETYVASNSLQLGHLVFRAKVDKVPITAMFDSGSSFLLTAKPALARYKPGTASTETPPPRYGYLAISVINGGIASYATLFEPDMSSSPPDVLVGVPVLATADIRLAFGPPSLCIIPKHARSQP